MPERIQREEEPINPVSITSAWRTTMALMEIFRDRPAPTCAFLLALATWLAAAYRLFWPNLVSTSDAGTCLVPDLIFAPHAQEWRRYLLHLLWPIDPSYARSFLLSAMLLLQGYTFEYEVGTWHFAALLLGVHVATTVVLLYFGLVACHVSSECALVALGVVMHGVNPKVHTDGLDKSMRVPFAIEPRWHLWAIQSLLLLLSQDFERVLIAHAVGLAAGGFLALRDREAWIQGWQAACQRSFGIGAPVHVALLLFCITFMPLTAQAWPAGLLQAATGGQILQYSWWETSFRGSPPLMHLAISGLFPEAYFICKLLISLACPLLLSPFRVWTRVYAGACILLAMYTMNTPVWKYPHAGFLFLLYLGWAFWKLPNAAVTRTHQA